MLNELCHSGAPECENICTWLITPLVKGKKMQEQDGTADLQKPVWFICKPVNLQLGEICQKTEIV